MTAILVIYFGHAHSPRSPFIVCAAAESQMTVPVAAASCFKWRYATSMSMSPPAGALAVPAMYTPTFIALLVFVAIGHGLAAAMIDTLGSKL